MPASGRRVPMDEFTAGTMLVTTDGSQPQVVGSQLRRGAVDVFNVEVEGAHNYFVAAPAGDGPGVLVHNTCRPQVSDRQFGRKWSGQARDYGYDVSDSTGRMAYRQMIDDVFASPDEVRSGPWNPQGGGGLDYMFYRQGENLLVTQADGTFVTLFPMVDGGNGWFNAATPVSQ